jgi:Tol biopolymer transport system component
MDIKLQPIDKLSLSLMLAFSIVIGGLVWGGKACGNSCFLSIGPHVKDFSWENQEVGAEDRAFTITFDRPMAQESVSKNLVINPPLPGKFSWAGRKLAYTLDTPVPYGQTYQVQLQGAREHFRGETTPGATIQPFVANFRSRDRAFAYIGTQGEEEGRLLLYNLTKREKIVLTPENLVVMDYKFYPSGERILFSGFERNLGTAGIQELQLYTVTTGLKEASFAKKPQIDLVLDNKDYQNHDFELSADGETIVVQRISRKNPADFDLWMLNPGAEPKPLKTQGGEFLIAPDGKTLAVAQGEGIAIIPLQTGAKPLDFLPKFGQVLNFSPDGSAAAMVNFNTDNAKLRYIKSLFYVNNQGLQKNLLNTEGSIIDCQFSPSGTHLYCLLTELLKGKEYQEQPYFAKINLKTNQVTPLMKLAKYQDVKISLSPDGLGILFDQIMAVQSNNPADTLTTNSGEKIVGSRLWSMILPSDTTNKPDLQPLPLTGIRPQWLP